MVKSDLNISLVQTDIVWENAEQNRNLLSRKMAALKGKQHILVLPEMFTTGFSMAPHKLAETMDGATVQWMKSQANSLRSIITGSVIIEEEGQYYNRLLWVLPNGEVAYYDKRHLFSYAGEQEHYSAGSQRKIAQVNGWKICLNVCYDLRFPVWTRNTDEYDLLLFVANWPEKRNEIWETLLKARAIENMSFVVGVNRVGEDGNEHQYIGNTSIYNPIGELLARATKDESIIHYTLQHQGISENRSRFGFLNDRDDFLLR
ncbi:MAG: amidohydrolase [Chitinophagaceae bacterium]|nr:amidohydrolase [Chitinophagaceae bacterium]